MHHWRQIHYSPYPLQRLGPGTGLGAAAGPGTAMSPGRDWQYINIYIVI